MGYMHKVFRTLRNMWIKNHYNTRLYYIFIKMMSLFIKHSLSIKTVSEVAIDVSIAYVNVIFHTCITYGFRYEKMV